MPIDQALVESVIPAAVFGLITLLVMTTTLRWWRGRLGTDDVKHMRDRIASAAPDPHLQAVDLAVARAGTARAGASSFVGRDRSAIRME